MSKFSITLQNTVPCSYQHFLWEKGIPAEAQKAASGSGLNSQGHFWAEQEFGCGWDLKCCRKHHAGPAQKHLEDALLGTSAREQQYKGETSAHPRKPSFSLSSLNCCGTSNPQLQLDQLGCEDTVHPGNYPRIHWGWKQLKILSLTLQLHLIISHYNQSYWLSGHLPCRGSAVQGVPRLDCFWWKVPAITRFLENARFQESSIFWLEAQRRAIPASTKGEPLSVEEGSKAQQVIFTRESTAKQAAKAESWLQCLLQVHKGNSH